MLSEVRQAFPSQGPWMPRVPTAGPDPPLAAMRSQHGFREVDRSGMIYNPLSNAWWLSESDLRTNYILAARKMA